MWMAGRGTERRKALSSCRLAFVRGRTKFGLNLCCILHATEDRLPTFCCSSSSLSYYLSMWATSTMKKNE